MAVYKQNYRPYGGSLTDQRWRFMILPRYSIRGVFESRLITAFFTLCFLPHVVAMGMIYLRNNFAALAALGIPPGSSLNIDGEFFLYLFTIQTFMSFFLVMFIGPGLISPDLANNALPLYLSRPFSRKEYILGKLMVLAALTSFITWIPGLFLVVIQTNLAGLSWLWDNMRVVVGIFVGSWIWILTISLLALALSAWSRSKPVAIVSMFGVFFFGAALGTAADELLRLQGTGTLLNLAYTMRMLWEWLLTGNQPYTIVERVREAAEVEGFIRTPGMPGWAGLISICVVCGVCLFLLTKKIRACEVVR
jgi:ABC-2 type transport system permease protein